jgi:hypothetical protein
MVPNKCLVIDDQFIPCSSIMVHPDGSISALIPLENKAVLMLELADGGNGVLSLFLDDEENRKRTATLNQGYIELNPKRPDREVVNNVTEVMNAVLYFGRAEIR